jgi:hypothetical protein
LLPELVCWVRTACSNGLLVRRDLVERKILGLLQEKLYCREAIVLLECLGQ